MTPTKTHEQQHGFLHMPHVPTLAEVQAIEPDTLRMKEGAQALLTYMFCMWLKAYRDEAGNYWFGRDDAGVAEHERWVYVIPNEQLKEENSWRSVRYGTMEGCDGNYLMYANLGFLDEIIELYGLQADTVDLVGRDRKMTATEEVAIRRKVLTMRRNCTYIMASEMATMVHAGWDQNLHDLMYHYDGWCAQHDAAGYPRELALRMHGLGEYVKASAGGWKWFKHIPSGPIS